MQTAITLAYNGNLLRGMEHMPDSSAGAQLPAVILFHGFTGNSLEPHRLFLKISRALAKQGLAVFRFDFLGSGESDGDFEQMTVSGEIAEAGAILDFVRGDARIDADRVSLIGISMGGLVASILAGDRHDAVDKLVLLCPAGNMYEIIKDSAEAFLADPNCRVYDFGGNLVGRDFPRDLKTIDVFERAGKYGGDVFLIHGTNDTAVAPQVTNLYQERAYRSRASVQFIEGADHTFNKHEWETEVIAAITGYFAP